MCEIKDGCPYQNSPVCKNCLHKRRSLKLVVLVLALIVYIIITALIWR